MAVRQMTQSRLDAQSRDLDWDTETERRRDGAGDHLQQRHGHKERHLALSRTACLDREKGKRTLVGIEIAERIGKRERNQTGQCAGSTQTDQPRGLVKALLYQSQGCPEKLFQAHPRPVVTNTVGAEPW